MSHGLSVRMLSNQIGMSTFFQCVDQPGDYHVCFLSVCTHEGRSHHVNAIAHPLSPPPSPPGPPPTFLIPIPLQNTQRYTDDKEPAVSCVVHLSLVC